ncbi:MAG: GWxTD domain-containing protein [Bacteroidia bacterium]
MRFQHLLVYKFAKLSLFGLVFLLGSQGLMAMDFAVLPSVWRHPISGPYVDLTLYFRPSPTSFDTLEEGNQVQQAAQEGIRVEILVYHREGIRAYDKYILRRSAGYELDSTGRIMGGDWADIRRFYLPPGRYGLEVKAVNLLDTLDRAVISKELLIDTQRLGTSLSTPVLLHRWNRSSENSRWVRNGYFLMNRPELPYRTLRDTLAFYTEVHTDSATPGRYLLQYALQDLDGRVVGSRQAYSRIPSEKSVHAVLGTWPLVDLEPGQYRLVMELKDSTNTTIDQKSIPVVRWGQDLGGHNRMFSGVQAERSAGRDSLMAWEEWLSGLDTNALNRQVLSLRPLCDPRQRATLDRLSKTQPQEPESMRNFIGFFWKNLAGEEEAVSRWWAYQEEVDKTLALFSSRITPGYETERGRVYLQYGPPNSRTVVDNEPSAYPYEVWWYYQIKGQRNVRFIFYNPDMVTNDYLLLHSDAFGENSDPQWRLQLFSRTTPFQNLDNAMNRGHFGSYLDDHLRNQ